MKTLPVGDELNILVNTHLFSVKLLSQEEMVTEVEKKMSQYPYMVDRHVLNGFCFESYIVNGQIVCRQIVRNYLDGNGMLAIMEKMKEKGYSYFLHYNREDVMPESVRGWAVEFGHEDDPSTWCKWHHAGDPVTATAQAALIVLGIL